MRSKLVRWLSTTALVAVVATFAGSANAGFGSSGGSSGSSYGGYSYGSSGGYASYSVGYGSSGYYGGSSGGSSGGYVQHVGPLRRLHNHIHNHFAAKAARRAAYYGSSGGSSGGVPYIASYGSSGGSSGGYSTYYSSGSSGGSSGSYIPASYSYGSSGGSSGSYAPANYVPTYSSGSSGGSTGSTVHYGSYDYAPSYDSTMGSYSTPSSNDYTSAKLASNRSVNPNEIHLMVNVPEEAKVYVNGNLTTSTGANRHFISRNLNEGESYRFELKAVVADASGKEIENIKTVVLNSGNGEEVTFDMSATSTPVETILTLNVPENAQVVLANNATKTSGAERVYRTKQLKDGETWDDYRISVTHDGVTKEKVIRLIGGDDLKLTFNFDDASDAKVAMK